eukprot:TRINITY_DN46709_c1_g1_i1.p1 TRINITY_DN46709_c1_g1~~TRINITY_DN46709_c1_g1_i1.p1  ORF type:complete len:127 (+),score=17.77 TRINITY_DN46709_c1_g1_i1:86-466(+)
MGAGCGKVSSVRSYSTRSTSASNKPGSPIRMPSHCQEVGIVVEEEWLDTDVEEEGIEEEEAGEDEQSVCQAEVYYVNGDEGKQPRHPIDPFSSDRLMCRRNAVCCKTRTDWGGLLLSDCNESSEYY